MCDKTEYYKELCHNQILSPLPGGGSFAFSEMAGKGILSKWGTDYTKKKITFLGRLWAESQNLMDGG